VTNTSSGQITGGFTGIAATGGPGPGGGPATVTVINAGTVNAAGFGMTIFTNAQYGGNIVVINSGTMTVAHGMDARAGESVNITNSGMISGIDGISTQSKTSIMVTNTGSILFRDDPGVVLAASEFTSGIVAVPFNVDQSLAIDTRITNSGRLEGAFYGVFSASAGRSTITNSGTIVGAILFADGGGIGRNNLDIVNSGSIAGALRSDGITHANAISFTGGANTLNLQPGWSLTGNIEVVGSVTFTQTNPVVLSNVITGPGDVTQAGSGMLTLSNLNTYTGATTVNAGTLAVNGSIVSSSFTTVNAGGTLAGTGTIGNTMVASGGTFAPGNATPGTSMTVAGNLAFQSGTLYLVQLNPATSTFTNVTGTASLNGNAGAVFLAGNYVAKQYTILTAAGGVTGTFSSFNMLGATFGLGATLSYDAHDVFLNLTLAPPTNLNTNQQNVYNTLTNYFNRTGGIPAAFVGLTPPQLTQISGETATGSQQTTFDAMNLFMGLLTDPFIAGRGDPVSAGAGATPYTSEDEAASAYAANGKARNKNERDAYAAIYRKAPIMADPFTQRWSVWAAGYGGSQTTDGNAVLGSNNTRSSIGGVAVGADYRFSPSTLAGFAMAGGGTNFSVNGLGGGRSDLFQVGAFMRHTVGPAYISAALAYGWQDVTTDRTVTIAGTGRLDANFNANAGSGRVEGGYRFVTPLLGGVGVTPYAAGQFTTFDLPAYAEQAIVGANTFALAYAAKSVTDTRGELGLRSDKSFAVQNGVFTLRGRAAWAHDFNPDRSIGATFQTLPGASFVVNGAMRAADAALVTASAEMKWLNGFSLAGTFEGELSSVTTSYAGKAVVRYAW
jgi:autotransporter-associated beta strand protein